MAYANDPMVRMLNKNKKIILVTMAKERGLPCHGKKIDLSIRLAEHEYERFSRDWDIISGRKE